MQWSIDIRELVVFCIHNAEPEWVMKDSPKWSRRSPSSTRRIAGSRPASSYSSLYVIWRRRSCSELHESENSTRIVVVSPRNTLPGNGSDGSPRKALLHPHRILGLYDATSQT
jgi:hypothetical protein